MAFDGRGAQHSHVLWVVAGAVVFHGGGVCSQNAAPAPLPVVWVLSTGGTIAGRREASTSLSTYKPGSILLERNSSSLFPRSKQR